MAAATIALPAPTPPPAPIRRAWREPARWLFAGLITFGLVELFVIFGPGAIRHPAPLLFAAVLFGLHGAFLIWILRRLDHLGPEPIALLAAALAWGGIVATSNAVRANVTADSTLTKLYPSTFVQRRGPLQRYPADLAGHRAHVDECPGTASVEYPGVAGALAQISAVRLGPIGISESDTIRAQRTRAGWLAVVGGSSLRTPLLVPIVLALWRVRAARQAHQYADPRLLTGLLIGVTLLVARLAFHAVGAAQID
jgi:hypothetical protein